MIYPDRDAALDRCSQARSLDELKAILRDIAVDTALDNLMLYTGMPEAARDIAKQLLNGADIEDTLRAAVLRNEQLLAKVAALVGLTPDDLRTLADIADMVTDPTKAASAAEQALAERANEVLFGKPGDPASLAGSLWGEAARDFVQAGKGPVTVLSGEDVQSILSAVQLPALMQGPPDRPVNGIPAGQLGPGPGGAQQQLKQASSSPAKPAGGAQGTPGEAGTPPAETSASDNTSQSAGGRPAARILDPTMHGPPLTPGTGSPNVLIGKKLAWRGLPAGAAASLQSAQQASDSVIKTAETTTQVAQAAAVAQAGSPTGPAAAAAAAAAYTAEQAAKTAAAAAMASLMSGLVAAAAASVAPKPGSPDTHICPIPTPVPPHGPGYVIDGSKTVLVNGLPLCRQMDTVLEALGGPDKIAMGEPTVLVAG